MPQSNSTLCRSHRTDGVRITVFSLTVVIAWISAVSNPAHAGLLFGIPANYASPGATSTLAVTLTNTGTTAADDVTIAGFSFEITASSSDVTFNNVAAGGNYIFSGNSLFGPDITLAVSPDGQTIGASDIFATPFAGFTLLHGQQKVLGWVSFSLSPTTPRGQIPVTFTPGAATGANDPSGIQFVVALQGDANINVIPEPASITSFGIGVLGVLLAFKKKGDKSK